MQPDITNPVLLNHPKAAFNAFLMMRFADTPMNHEIVKEVRASLARYAIDVLRADQQTYATSLWENVRFYMDACDFGIAVFDQTASNDFNPNVSLELGYMMADKKRLLLLKDKTLPKMPSDLVGQLYKEFDPNDVTRTVRQAIQTWLRDVGIAKSAAEKLVVFVSHGGTCRCAMSKIVANRAFAGRSLPFRIRFESMAAKFGNAVHASHNARQAILEAFGEDTLESHRVMKRNEGIIEDADLILVMEESLMNGLPKTKTQLMTEFFGDHGTVQNPWPDDEDAGARERYRNCLTQLRALIEPHGDKLIHALT
jgi:protein-tyrosine-phosphatase/nucleoside 2-deoxyribosyltransferase